MPTLTAAATISAETGVRVLSSAIASAWAVLGHLVGSAPTVVDAVTDPALRALMDAAPPSEALAKGGTEHYGRGAEHHSASRTGPPARRSWETTGDNAWRSST